MTYTLGIELINAKKAGIKALRKGLEKTDDVTMFEVDDRIVIAPVTEDAVDVLTNYGKNLGLNDTNLLYVGVNPENGDFSDEFAEPYSNALAQELNIENATVPLADVERMLEVAIDVDEELENQTNEPDDIQTKDTESADDTSDDVAPESDTETADDNNAFNDDDPFGDEPSAKPEVTGVENVEQTEDDTIAEPEDEDDQTPTDPIVERAINLFSGADLTTLELPEDKNLVAVLPVASEVAQNAEQARYEATNKIYERLTDTGEKARNYVVDSVLIDAQRAHDDTIDQIESQRMGRVQSEVNNVVDEHKRGAEAYVRANMQRLYDEYEAQEAQRFEQAKQDAKEQANDKVDRAVSEENDNFDAYQEEVIAPYVTEQYENVDISDIVDEYNKAIADANDKIQAEAKRVRDEQLSAEQARDTRYAELQKQFDDLKADYDLLNRNVDVTVESRTKEKELNLNNQVFTLTQELHKVKDELLDERDKSRALSQKQITQSYSEK